LIFWLTFFTDCSCWVVMVFGSSIGISESFDLFSVCFSYTFIFGKTGLYLSR